VSDDDTDRKPGRPKVTDIRVTCLSPRKGGGFTVTYDQWILVDGRPQGTAAPK
jgi:hypothetical protein